MGCEVRRRPQPPTGGKEERRRTPHAPLGGAGRRRSRGHRLRGGGRGRGPPRCGRLRRGVGDDLGPSRRDRRASGGVRRSGCEVCLSGPADRAHPGRQGAAASPLMAFVDHLLEAPDWPKRCYGGLIRTGTVEALRTLVETLPSRIRSKSPSPRLPTDRRVGPPRPSAAFSRTEAGSPSINLNRGR